MKSPHRKSRSVVWKHSSVSSEFQKKRFVVIIMWKVLKNYPARHVGNSSMPLKNDNFGKGQSEPYDFFPCLKLNLWNGLSHWCGKGRFRFSAEFMRFDELFEMDIEDSSVLAGDHSSGDHWSPAGARIAGNIESRASGRLGLSEKGPGDWVRADSNSGPFSSGMSLTCISLGTCNRKAAVPIFRQLINPILFRFRSSCHNFSWVWVQE